MKNGKCFEGCGFRATAFQAEAPPEGTGGQWDKRIVAFGLAQSGGQGGKWVGGDTPGSNAAALNAIPTSGAYRTHVEGPTDFWSRVGRAWRCARGVLT